MDTDDRLQTAALEELALAPNYQRWLAGMAQPFLGERALELGSGLGDYAQIWLDQGAPSVWLTEAEPQRLELLRERFASDARVSVSSLESALDSGEKFTSFVSYNVLEHVDAPVELLKAAQRALEPGATVMAFVPAFPVAMSDFDRRIGHRRRYTRESLARELSSAGLAIQTLRYVNVPGLLAWIVGMRMLRLTPTEGPTVRAWDRWVVPFAKRMERGRSMPFGQSIWSVSRVRG